MSVPGAVLPVRLRQFRIGLDDDQRGRRLMHDAAAELERLNDLVAAMHTERAAMDTELADLREIVGPATTPAKSIHSKGKN